MNRKYPAKVIVELEVTEVDMEIAEGVKYTFWTFGGTVPGSFKVQYEGGTHFQENVQTTLIPAGGAATVSQTEDSESAGVIRTLRDQPGLLPVTASPLELRSGRRS